MNKEAIQNKSRRDVYESLETLKAYTRHLEATLQKGANEVIPWYIVEGISKSACQILYSAGHVNACILSRD